MRWIRIAVPVAAIALVLTAAPAHAQTVTRQDRQGDAPPRIDVTSATYTHAADRLRVVAEIPDLGRSGTAALSLSKFGVFEAGYVVEIKKRPGRTPRTALYYYNHFDLEPRACSSVTGVWGRERVILSVKRSCLRGHARARMFAQFGIQYGSHVDRAPAVRRLRHG